MDSIASITTLKALDGLSRRAEVTAENIANAGTANYRPLKVSFEQALIDAAKQGPAAVKSVQPTVSQVEGGPLGSELRLDRELTTASTTQARYSALIEVLNRQLQLRALATGGR